MTFLSLADDLVRFDTFGATGTKDFDDHDAASFGRILRGSGRAGWVGLPSATMRGGRVRPLLCPCRDRCDAGAKARAA